MATASVTAASTAAAATTKRRWRVRARLAVGAHARVHDDPWRWLPAIGMLAWCSRVLRGFQVGDLQRGHER
jgi:hypothetical protein